MKLYYNNKEIPCEILSQESYDGGLDLEVRPFTNDLFRLNISPISDHPFITINQSKQKYYIAELDTDLNTMILHLDLRRWML